MKPVYSILLALFLVLPAYGQVIVVSDVDDTIKVSHVLDKDSAVANLVHIDNAFIGMPELYHLITEPSDVITLKYLSNAPKRLVGRLHKSFLKKNKFPKGELVTRGWRQVFSGNSHKLNSIRKFIESYSPREMILIGDNGEADITIYDQIRREFPEILTTVYIRTAYSKLGVGHRQGKVLLPGQIPFASSLDIALDLLSRGHLSRISVEQFITQTVPRMLEEPLDLERGRPMAFPAWYDCRDFILSPAPLLIDLSAQKLLTQYQVKVQSRCSMLPIKY